MTIPNNCQEKKILLRICQFLLVQKIPRPQTKAKRPQNQSHFALCRVTCHGVQNAWSGIFTLLIDITMFLWRQEQSLLTQIGSQQQANVLLGETMSFVRVTQSIITPFGGMNLGQWIPKMRKTNVLCNDQLYLGYQTIYILRAFLELSNVM